MGRHHWLSNPTSCPEQVLLQQDAQGLVDFLISARVESCQPLWAPALVSDHTSGKKLFSFILPEFPMLQLVLAASHPNHGHL